MMDFVVANLDRICFVAVFVIAMFSSIVASVYCTKCEKRDDYIKKLETYNTRLRMAIDDKENELYVLKATAYDTDVSTEKELVTVNH